MLIQRVARNSPAQTLGLRGGEIEARILGRELLVGGDIVLSVQGVPVMEDSFDEISEALTEVRPGDEVTVIVLRSGHLVELKARLDG